MDPSEASGMLKAIAASRALAYTFSPTRKAELTRLWVQTDTQPNARHAEGPTPFLASAPNLAVNVVDLIGAVVGLVIFGLAYGIIPGGDRLTWQWRPPQNIVVEIFVFSVLIWALVSSIVALVR
jgi:hypothetical protein